MAVVAVVVILDGFKKQNGGTPLAIIKTCVLRLSEFKRFTKTKRETNVNLAINYPFVGRYGRRKNTRPRTRPACMTKPRMRPCASR